MPIYRAASLLAAANYLRELRSREPNVTKQANLTRCADYLLGGAGTAPAAPSGFLSLDGAVLSVDTHVLSLS